MSGYDRSTGWCHFTPKKWRRYHRLLPGEPDDVAERCHKQNLPFYFDHAGGLHAHCGEGALWTLLSGEPAVWDSGPPPDVAKPEYLTATDIGANLVPPMSAVKTNRALAAAGFQVRETDAWVTTPKGLALCVEIDSEGGRFGAKTYLKWSFEIIEILRPLQE